MVLRQFVIYHEMRPMKNLETQQTEKASTTTQESRTLSPQEQYPQLTPEALARAKANNKATAQSMIETMAEQNRLNPIIVPKREK